MPAAFRAEVGLYDRVWWWGDVNHLVNSMIFAAAVGVWAGRYPLGSTSRFALALGLGVTLQVLWEIGEDVVLADDRRTPVPRTRTRSAISLRTSRARSPAPRSRRSPPARRMDAPEREPAPATAGR